MIAGWFCDSDAVAAEPAPHTAAVTLDVTAPAALPDIHLHDLEVRLYSYEPFVADMPATLMDMASVPFDHITGAAETTSITLGEDAALAQRLQYYVTVFVLHDGARTHIGERDGRPGLMHVLTDGHPAQLDVILRPVH
ncbi:MAG: hypothetical protein LJE69_03665 [Thiohalocapsa sp.]|jgi:hypothetical protein|uniref:hypothetical protein n=1 Tax=Thiohalocapsa sp. TaxID=2497641 RepID=UPI0025DF4A71|nr:hypothetical protein [Thiohalocapsa sp.]MCG6940332.1 hypothetical protein [Thiohalocapsa sp.]